MAAALETRKARYFMRKVEKHTARATARVEREAPESKTFVASLAEAVCERPGSRVGLWGAPCPRGVARLWLGVERGGFCTSCGSSRSSEADRATRLWTCVAAPARGGQVGGCSGGVQRLRNLGGRRGARAERDCGPNALPKEFPLLCPNFY